MKIPTATGADKRVPLALGLILFVLALLGSQHAPGDGFEATPDRSPLAAFAAEGAVRANVAVEPLDAINDVFGRMERGQIEGRIVLRP